MKRRDLFQRAAGLSLAALLPWDRRERRVGGPVETRAPVLVGGGGPELFVPAGRLHVVLTPSSACTVTVNYFYTE